MYQTGNYIKPKGLELAKIKKISEDYCWFITQSGLHAGLPLYEIQPVPLNLNALETIGFSKILETQRLLHIEYSYEIVINGVFHYLKGIKYKGLFKWNILNLSVTYVHELQNYFKLVDTKTELVLF